MKSVICLAVVAACVMAAPLKKVVDLTKFNDSCLTCLLADGVYCEGEKQTDNTCLDMKKEGVECKGTTAKPKKLIKGFNQCGRKYFEMNDLKLWRNWPYTKRAKSDGKELDAKAKKVYVRNCKNIELPFNPNAKQSTPSAEQIKLKPGHLEMKEPNDLDGTMQTKEATKEAKAKYAETGLNHQIIGNYTIDLAPNSACYFTATNNMKNFVNEDGESQEYMMGVNFQLQNLYDVKILVDNNLPMWPEVWSAEATTKNWLLYTNINPTNNNDKGIEKKLTPANGRVPVLPYKPRHFLLINPTDKEKTIQVFFGAATALKATILSAAGLMALFM